MRRLRGRHRRFVDGAPDAVVGVFSNPVGKPICSMHDVTQQCPTIISTDTSRAVMAPIGDYLHDADQVYTTVATVRTSPSLYLRRRNTAYGNIEVAGAVLYSSGLTDVV